MKLHLGIESFSPPPQPPKTHTRLHHSTVSTYCLIAFQADLQADTFVEVKVHSTPS
ncbi:hypothetical protein LguiA_026949 [Lonicera macranthoides]